MNEQNAGHAASGTTPGTAILDIDNTSEIDLVVAIQQGLVGASQTAKDARWLNMKTAAWETPALSASSAWPDLADYVVALPAAGPHGPGRARITLSGYEETAGFRCLVADADAANGYPAVAIQSSGSGTSLAYYMAFPDLMSANFVYDKFEGGLGWDAPSQTHSGVWNITAVDFVALPMQLSMGARKVGFMDGVSFAGLKPLLAATPSPYDAGAYPKGSKSPYRFFSPAHIAPLNGCLDEQIRTDLAKLDGAPQAVNYSPYTFTRFTASWDAAKNRGTIACSYATTTDPAPKSLSVDNVDTDTAIGGTIGLNATSSGEHTAREKFGALIAAAICRGVLGNPGHWGSIQFLSCQCPAPQYYYPSGVSYDAYSKVIHDYSLAGKNYGFSFDDVFGDLAGFTVTASTDDPPHVALTVLPHAPETPPAMPAPYPRPSVANALAVALPATGDPATWGLGTVACGTAEIPGNRTTTLCDQGDRVTLTFSAMPGYSVQVALPGGALRYGYPEGVRTRPTISNMAYDPATNILGIGAPAFFHDLQVDLAATTLTNLGTVAFAGTALTSQTSYLMSEKGCGRIALTFSRSSVVMTVDVAEGTIDCGAGIRCIGAELAGNTLTLPGNAGFYDCIVTVPASPLNNLGTLSCGSIQLQEGANYLLSDTHGNIELAFSGQSGLTMTVAVASGTATFDKPGSIAYAACGAGSVTFAANSAWVPD